MVGLTLKLKLQYFGHLMRKLTHWKRPWCWEGLGAGGEGDDRGWDGWMASPTQWTWVWVNSRSWWWTGRPSVLRFMGSQRVGHNWATGLSWTEHGIPFFLSFKLSPICDFMFKVRWQDLVGSCFSALHWQCLLLIGIFRLHLMWLLTWLFMFSLS